jgi:hypothetical protein
MFAVNAYISTIEHVFITKRDIHLGMYSISTAAVSRPDLAARTAALIFVLSAKAASATALLSQLLVSWSRSATNCPLIHATTNSSDAAMPFSAW